MASVLNCCKSFKLFSVFKKNKKVRANRNAEQEERSDEAIECLSTESVPNHLSSKTIPELTKIIKYAHFKILNFKTELIVLPIISSSVIDGKVGVDSFKNVCVHRNPEPVPLTTRNGMKYES